jgi:multidrug transporter EmrE-like cation transporter
MTPQGLLLVTLAALVTVCANLTLREGVVRGGGLSLSLATLLQELGRLAQQPLFVIGALLYGAASLIWLRIVSGEKLNSSYPVLVGMTFVFVTAGATLLFREPLSPQKVVGLLVILLGIGLVAAAQ